MENNNDLQSKDTYLISNQLVLHADQKILQIKYIYISITLGYKLEAVVFNQEQLLLCCN